MGGWAKVSGRSISLVSVIAGITLLASVAVAQTPSLTLIGVPPGRLDSTITSMSSDGGAFTGYTTASGGVRRGFTWTRAGGFNEWGALPSVPQGTRGLAISGDGSTVVGRRDLGTTIEAFRYRGGTYSTLAPLPSGYDWSTATGINNNGSVIVGTIEDSSGLRGTNAMRWTAATGTQNIGRAQPNHAGANFNGLSRDGNTAIGVSFPGGIGGRAYSWTESGGWRFLPMPDGFAPAYDATTTGVSFDGSFVTGYSAPFTSGSDRYAGILWQNGVPRDLGTFGEPWNMFPSAVSDNGSVIVGGSRNVDTSIETATIWLNGGGPLNLQDYLMSLGVTLPAGVRMIGAGSVSADGTVISGAVMNGFRLQGFIATIPTPTTLAPVLLTFLIPRRRRLTA